MKKMTLIFLSALGFFACNKDKKECNISAANISGPYKTTSMLYRPDPASAETEVYPIWFDDCERDDVLTFNENGTYVSADVGVVCAPAGGDNGTWSVSGNNMIVDGDPATIESFDCKKLVIVETDVQQPGDRIRLTLIRQ
jgi:hypothetical protein